MSKEALTATEKVAKQAHMRAAIYFVLAVALGVAVFVAATSGNIGAVVLVATLLLASAILSGVHTLAGLVLEHWDGLR